MPRLGRKYLTLTFYTRYSTCTLTAFEEQQEVMKMQIVKTLKLTNI